MNESKNKPGEKNNVRDLFVQLPLALKERIEAYDNTLAARKIRIAIPSALSTISTTLPAFQSFLRFRIKKQSPSRFATSAKYDSIRFFCHRLLQPSCILVGELSLLARSSLI